MRTPPVARWTTRSAATLTACAAIAAAACGDSSGPKREHPDGVPLVSFDDPANDTLPNDDPGVPRANDVRSIAISVKRDSLVLTLRFRAPIAPASAVGVLEIDADEDASTGPGAIMDRFGAESGLGVEYAIIFETSSPMSAEVFPTANASASAEIPVTVSGDAVVIRVPLRRIGGDANFDFGGIIGTDDRPTDWFPNTGVYTVHAQSSAAAARAAAPRAADDPRLGRARRSYAPWPR